MKATIAATIARIGGLTQTRSAFGQLTGGSSFDELDLELGSATIDIEHDPEMVAGEIVYAELTEDDRVAVVGVLEHGDWLEEIGQPVYFSGDWLHRGKDVKKDYYVASPSSTSSTGRPASLRTGSSCIRCLASPACRVRAGAASPERLGRFPSSRPEAQATQAGQLVEMADSYS